MTVRKDRTLYLDYVNNWITVASFANHHGMEENEARQLIDRERNHPDNQGSDHELQLTFMHYGQSINVFKDMDQ
jgi:hypothetical protein